MLWVWDAMKVFWEGEVRSWDGWKGTARAVRFGSREVGSTPKSGWRVCRGVEGGQAAPQVEKDRSARKEERLCSQHRLCCLDNEARRKQR
jgi:hypothetical protein